MDKTAERGRIKIKSLCISGCGFLPFSFSATISFHFHVCVEVMQRKTKYVCVEAVLCVSPEHLGLVRSQLNEVTLTITRDACLCVCLCGCVCVCVWLWVRVSLGVHLQHVCASSVCACTCVRLCDWQAQTVCDVLINHIDSLLLR